MKTTNKTTKEPRKLTDSYLAQLIQMAVATLRQKAPELLEAKRAHIKVVRTIAEARKSG
ncbi:MAG: hypothetical protein V4819_11265 [Verrucomicrobiota bacterium]